MRQLYLVSWHFSRFCELLTKAQTRFCFCSFHHIYFLSDVSTPWEICFYIFWYSRHGYPTTVARRVLLATACLLFVSTIAGLAVGIAYALASAAAYTGDPSTVLLLERLWPAGEVFTRLNVCPIYCHSYSQHLFPQCLITDFTVVWRAWILSGHYFVHVILIICMIGSVGKCPLQNYTTCDMFCSWNICRGCIYT